jgi:hypothetical protein
VELQAEQVVQLDDAAGNRIGQMVIDQLEGDLVMGRFVPAEGFARIKPLFDEFNELVDNQILSLLDEVDARIDALGLHLCAEGDLMPAIYDVQIGGGTINFRLRREASHLPNDASSTPEASPTVNGMIGVLPPNVRRR